MHGLIGRLAKLEAMHQAREPNPDTPQIRIILTAQEWDQVPIGALVHRGGTTLEVYRKFEPRDPQSNGWRVESVDIPWDLSWGHQPIDYFIPHLG